MYLQDFINKYNGKKIDFDGAYGNQCVDLFRFFNKEVLEIAQPKGVNGAKDFWGNYANDPNLYNNFDKIANTPSFVPQFGDIAIFNNGTHGHISICNGKGTTSRFESFDQNYPTNSACHIQSHNYKEFYGVLRPKNQSKLSAPVSTNFTVRVDKAIANVRSKPNSQSALAGSKQLEKGNTFVAVGTVVGENVSGNNIWYQSAKGNFVWSGDLTRI